MNFTTNATNLAGALALVMRCINRTHPATAARNVLVQADGDSVTLTGSDLDTVARITLAATVRQPGTVLLDPQHLATVLLRPSAAVAEFKATGQRLSLVVGRNRTTLHTMDVGDYPRVPDFMDEPLLVLPGVHVGLVANQVAFASAAAEMDRPNLLGAALRFKPDHIQAVATNGLRGAELRLPYNVSGRGQATDDLVLLPSSLDRMQKMFGDGDAVQVSHKDSWACFRTEDSRVVFYTLLQADPFPGSIDAVLDRARAQVVSWAECDVAILRDVVRRMDVVAGGDPLHPLRLRTYGNRLEMFSSTASRGTSLEEVDVDRDGPEYCGVVSAAFFSDLLGKIDGDRVRIQFPEKDTAVILLEPAHPPEGAPPYLVFLMPVNPGAQGAAATLSGPQHKDGG